jgi:hypothetical protein
MISLGTTIVGSSRVCHLQIGVGIHHDGGVTESRTADDASIAGFCEHIHWIAVGLHGAAVTGINEIRRDAQVRFVASATDQVAKTVFVDFFTGISSNVRKLDRLCEHYTVVVRRASTD